MAIRPEDGTPVSEEDKRLIERLRHYAHILREAADLAEAANYSGAASLMFPVFEQITSMHMAAVIDMGTVTFGGNFPQNHTLN